VRPLQENLDHRWACVPQCTRKSWKKPFTSMATSHYDHRRTTVRCFGIEKYHTVAATREWSLTRGQSNLAEAASNAIHTLHSLECPVSAIPEKSKVNLAPRYLADHLTPASDVASRLRLRSANRHQLIVPLCRLSTYGRRAFSIAGPTVWNSLLRELRDPACGLTVLNSFSRQSFLVSTNVTAN